MQIEINGPLELVIHDAVLSGEFKWPEEFITTAIKNFRIQRLDAELEKGYLDIENGDVLKVTNIGQYFKVLNQRIDTEAGCMT